MRWRFHGERMRKKILWIGLVGLLALGAAFYWRGAGDGGRSPGAAGGRRGGDDAPRAVSVAEVRRGDIDVVLSALGTVTAHNTTVVKSRVSGLLQRIAFQEGQLVKAGDLLAEIDPRPFRAQLDQAVGQLARDQALLTNAKADLARYQALLAKDSIARQQVDTQAALVKQYEGTVQTDQGNAENARLQLAFTRITAPISGRLGLRRVDVGNMVNTSDANGIVVITQTQPIAAVFSVPADNLSAVLQGIREEKTLSVEAWDQDYVRRLAVGSLRSVDNQIDTATGTVKLKAEFANADETLFPNQFVNIRLRVATHRDSLLVPVTAMQQGRPGTFVYVVDAGEKKVAIRLVTPGARTADTVSIINGLTVGEQVVVDGVDRLREGAKVEPIALPASKTRQSGEASTDVASPEAKRDERSEPTKQAAATGSGTAAGHRPDGKGRE